MSQRHKTGPGGRPQVFYSDIKIKRDENGNKIDEKDEVGTGEFYQLMAMFAGAMTYYYRSKLACWCTIYLFISSILNFKHEHAMQQVMTSMSLITIMFA